MANLRMGKIYYSHYNNINAAMRHFNKISTTDNDYNYKAQY